MGTFPTYGMAGVGIAAAIGFVFALSFLGNNSAVDDGASLQSEAPEDLQRMSEPAPESGDDASTFAKDSAEESGAAPAGESAMMQADSGPVLTSIVALDGNRGFIGEVVPGMEFEAGQPVLIQASLANGGPEVIANHFVAMSIQESSDAQSLAGAANFHGAIAANSSVALELRWIPQSGDYMLVLYSAASESDAGEPDAEIPIKVN